MDALKEFLGMLVDGRLVVDACLLKSGLLIECYSDGIGIHGLAEYTLLLPSRPGLVFLIYKRRSSWIYFFVPIGEEIWFVFKTSYEYLSHRRSLHVVLDTLSDMSYRIGKIIALRRGSKKLFYQQTEGVMVLKVITTKIYVLRGVGMWR